MSNSPEFFDPCEDGEWLPGHDLLRSHGFEVLPPSDIDDFQLRGRLWELIYALAGRRIYLSFTDHLGDRALYEWIHNWLFEVIADIPLEAETNTRIGVVEDHDSDTWMRFYASEDDRQFYAKQDPDLILPPRQVPPHDRDRWLPEPPGFPVEDDLPKIPEDLADESDEDPLGLAAADAAIQEEAALAKEREEVLGITGGESAGWQRPVDQLKKANISLLPPDELTDETLTAKLWELLHNLACQGFYVLCTNHISDRELYTNLWQRGLRDEAILPGKIKTGGWYHDFLGTGSDEDHQLWLRYYASEARRAQEARDYPNTPIPPRETPPYNRDWRLPKGPF